MTAHVANWVLPITSPPIREGAVVVENGRIVLVGPAQEVLKGFSGRVCDHGHGAILPGVVNCHAHLEFSALAGQVPPQERWEDWLEATLAESARLSPEEVDAGIAQGIKALRQSGAALVAEVTNTGASWPYLEQAALQYHLFYECLGFDLLEQKDLTEWFPFFSQPRVAAAAQVSAAAHAPYSVSVPLFRAIREWNAARGRPQTVHLGESRAEVEFLARGNGFFEGLLRRRGRWVADFSPPRLSPGAYLERLGFLGRSTLTVHGVWLEAGDLEALRRSGTWMVLCPRANRYTGAGTPPVAALIEAGILLALGTDSLAGNWDLNLFGEMLWLYRNFPAYPGDQWLRLGTINGALALGRDGDLGSLEAGKAGALGFIPLMGAADFWDELYTAGARGGFCWLG